MVRKRAKANSKSNPSASSQKTEPVVSVKADVASAASVPDTRPDADTPDTHVLDVDTPNADTPDGDRPNPHALDVDTPDADTPDTHVLLDTNEPNDSSEVVRVVDAVVDRRELEVEHPEPIHPMDVVGQHLGETKTDEIEHGDAIAVTATKIDDTDDTDEDAVMVVKAIALDSDSTDQANGPAHHPQPETVLSGPVVDELNAAIATAHQHEAELETHLTAIEQQQQQLQQQLTQAQAEITTLKQQLAATQEQETILKQQVTDLKTECDRTATQLTQAQQAQSQLTQQTATQAELDQLRSSVASLTTELEEAKGYILKLTQSQQPAQSPPSPQPQRPGQPQHLAQSQRPGQSSQARSPDLLPKRLPSHHPPQALAGRAPRSTEQFQPSSPAPQSGPVQPQNSPTNRQANRPQQVSRTSERLRPAYTRPGFPNHSSDPLPQRRQPLPQLPGPSQQERSSNRQPALQSAQSSSPGSAMVTRRQAPLAARRSRRFDDIRPELKSSQIPKPKVSDKEIGWFD
ncbi:MAG: hypothetical protein AB4042_01800 [Leptolyngbyaceae cyanobacterium]